MELVKGVTITEYADSNHLSTKQRLTLFAAICRAVHHAHQKGVIHRDLKPSNVMVALHDGKPVAKVIDFGVSKAVSQPLTEQTLFTRYGQVIGTPQYMSPEQAEMSGLDVDTRSDIYSLNFRYLDRKPTSSYCHHAGTLAKQQILRRTRLSCTRAAEEERQPYGSKRLMLGRYITYMT